MPHGSFVMLHRQSLSFKHICDILKAFADVQVLRAYLFAFAAADAVRRAPVRFRDIAVVLLLRREIAAPEQTLGVV